MSGAEHQTADAADVEHPENAQDNQDLKSPPARGTGKKALAVFGAGALLAGGGIFAYNSLHQSEEAFSADGEEYAQVCQDSNTGLRVEDEQCEKAEKEAGNTPSDSSSGSSGDSHSGTQNSGNSGTTHHSGTTNAFLWYYLGRRSAGTTSIPAVGSSLSGGSTTRPNSGTVYSGLSRSGGGFESSYKSAKKTSTYSSGKVTESRSGGKTTTSKGTGLTGNNSGGKGGSSSNNKGGGSGSKGGFGGGSKSGGGTSGG